VIELADGPHLFLDDALVASTHNITRQLQQPAKCPGGPILFGEHPWEANGVQVYGNALFDEGRFRLWYHASEKRDPKDVPWDVPDTGRLRNIYNACLAESDDGIVWSKRLSTPIDFPPYDRHNVLINDMHSISVLRDADDDPSRRYKALGGDKTAVSPDGIHWQVRTNEAVGKNDTGASLIHWKGEYLAFVRQQTRAPDWPVVRAVGLSTSTDFDRWTPKITVLETDADDGHPFTQPYGLCVFSRGDLLIGLLYTIVLDREQETEHAWKWNNRVGDYRVELVCSRDGRQWSRVADRAEFFTPTPGAWDSARVWPGTSVLIHNDTMYLYYSGTTARHGQGAGSPFSIGLATLPVDRMLAVTACNPRKPGVVTTPPISMAATAGSDLIINADIPDPGTLHTEVTHPDGTVVAGFDRATCGLTVHDSLRWRVRWGAKGLGEAPAGSALRISLGAGVRLYALEARPALS